MRGPGAAERLRKQRGAADADLWRADARLLTFAAVGGRDPAGGAIHAMSTLATSGITPVTG
jgi:hypothetical protein